MKAVAMAVSYENISSITYVDTIGIVGDILTTNASQKLTIFIKHDNTVTLQNSKCVCYN